MERNTVLRKEGEVGIGGIVDDGGGEEAASGRDERRRRPLRLLRRDESVGEYAARRIDLHGRIGVDVDIVHVLILRFAEENFPKGAELEVGVGEEEEGDLGGRGETGLGRGTGPMLPGRIRLGNGFLKQGEVVELIGEGDWELVRREDSGGDEEYD